MTNILNLEKSRHEREIKELAVKLTRIGEEVFAAFAREGLTFSDAEKFVRVVLPGMFQEKINTVVMGRYVDEVLKEISERVADK